MRSEVSHERASVTDEVGYETDEMRQACGIEAKGENSEGVMQRGCWRCNQGKNDTTPITRS